MMSIGVMGYGRNRPLWNLFAPYFPEKDLEAINPNHLIVEVGVVSSDHDRACEAVYQLVGGTVDYGKEHSEEKSACCDSVDVADDCRSDE